MCACIVHVNSEPGTATGTSDLTFPVTSDNPLAAASSYRCLKSFSAKVRELNPRAAIPPPGVRHRDRGHNSQQQLGRRSASTGGAMAAETAAEEAMLREQAQMVYDPAAFVPANDLGPRVYESSTLTYRMFGFKGPLWMHQTCNEGSVRMQTQIVIILLFAIRILVRCRQYWCCPLVLY